MRKIHSLTYNWRAGVNGEYADGFTVGIIGVTEIRKHGDDSGMPYFAVYFEDNAMTEIFNPNVVTWKKVEEEPEVAFDPYNLPF